MAIQSRHEPFATRWLLFSLAWRNLWRNNRRTLIACSSVFFAVFLSVLVSSTQSGQNEMLIDAAVGFSTGHIQIQGRGYWDDRSLDRSMSMDTALIGSIGTLPAVSSVVLRLEAVCLVAHESVTRVTPVLGIIPELEHAMTGLGRYLVRGDSLSTWHEGAIVAAGLARLLRADVGDTLVILGQGYRGATAAGLVRISALAEFAIPDLNTAMVYIPLGTAQELFAAPERITSLAIMIENDEDLPALQEAIRLLADSDLDVLNWRELLPELVQAIAVNNGGTVVMLLVLYLVIGFGIFGTVMMMATERRREFGMLIALGMRKSRLVAVVALEALFISLVGCVAGIVASVPVVVALVLAPIRLGGDYAEAMLAYGLEPIVPFSTTPEVFWAQAVIVAGLGILSASYPALMIRSLNPASAMRT